MCVRYTAVEAGRNDQVLIRRGGVDCWPRWPDLIQRPGWSRVALQTTRWTRRRRRCRGRTRRPPPTCRASRRAETRRSTFASRSPTRPRSRSLPPTANQTTAARSLRRRRRWSRPTSRRAARTSRFKILTCFYRTTAGTIRGGGRPMAGERRRRGRPQRSGARRSTRRRTRRRTRSPSTWKTGSNWRSSRTAGSGRTVCPASSASSTRSCSTPSRCRRSPPPPPRCRRLARRLRTARRAPAPKWRSCRTSRWSVTRRRGWATLGGAGRTRTAARRGRHRQTAARWRGSNKTPGESGGKIQNRNFSIPLQNIIPVERHTVRD